MAKKVLSLKVECINKQEQKNGGTITLAVGVEPGEQGRPTARKILNYRTMDSKELAGFTPGKNYAVQFDELP